MLYPNRPKNLLLLSARKRPRTGLYLGLALLALVVCCAGLFIVARLNGLTSGSAAAAEPESVGRTIIYEIIVPASSNGATPGSPTPVKATATPSPAVTPTIGPNGRPLSLAIYPKA